jgi:hypothetical protein
VRDAEIAFSIGLSLILFLGVWAWEAGAQGFDGKLIGRQPARLCSRFQLGEQVFREPHVVTASRFASLPWEQLLFN